MKPVMDKQQHDGSSRASLAAPESQSMHGEKAATHMLEVERFKKLTWPRMALCLVVEAIALGTLSLPSAFGTLGLIPGLVCAIGLGVIATYGGYVTAQATRKHTIRGRAINSFNDLGELMFGRAGREVFAIMFVLILLLASASHTLTGSIAFTTIVGSTSVCSIVWSVISMVLLFFFSLPRTWAEFSWIGFIDFGSIIAAVLITMVATGIQADQAPGGRAAVDWALFPAVRPTFAEAMNAINNLAFAYSFSIALPSFQSELARPDDFPKAIVAIGIVEVVIYTLTGSIIYVFTGSNVRSPAILSATGVIPRIAFGVALPVIFISGAVLVLTATRYLYGRTFEGTRHEWISTRFGVGVWVALTFIFVVLGFILAQAIPVFSDLLSITSSLFISGFSYYLPATSWFLLVKEGRWNANGKNMVLSILNALVFLVGIFILAAGTYASAISIQQSSRGGLTPPFTCKQR